MSHQHATSCHQVLPSVTDTQPAPHRWWTQWLRAALACTTVGCLLLGLPAARHAVTPLMPATFSLAPATFSLYTNVATSTTSVLFLCATPNLHLLEFASELVATTRYSVYVIIDDNQLRYTYHDTAVHLIQLNNTLVRAAGYTDLSPGDSFGMGWEKAMYTAATLLPPTTEFVWVMEEDVFVPSVATLTNLTEHAHDHKIDYVSTAVASDPKWDWWLWIDNIQQRSPQLTQRVHGLQCMIGMSRRMLDVIARVAAINQRLDYLEAFIPMVAYNSQLNVWHPAALDTIQYRQTYTLEDIIHQGIDHVFHPIKQAKLHQQYRQSIAAGSSNSTSVDPTR